MPRLLIADGSSQIHRTFHALARSGAALTAPDGRPTGALLSFLNVLRKAVRTHEPTHVAVTFDRSRTSFRTELFPSYKQQRDATPEDLITQIDLAREALAALNIPLVELDDYEADDVIATLAERAAAAGWQVVILSSDKDLMQLVRPGVVLHHASRDEIMDEAAVTERFGVPPDLVADVLAIMGDASDNIPGVRGIGEKGALGLVSRHGGVENILAHLPEIEADEELGRGRKRMVSLLSEQADQLRLARRLTDLVRDAPVPVAIDDLAMRAPDADATRALFGELGLTRLLQDLGLAEGAPSPAAAASSLARVTAGLVVAPSRDVMARLADAARSSGTMGLALADGREDGELPLGQPPARVGLSAGTEDAVAIELEAAVADAGLRAVLADAAVGKAGFGLKTSIRRLGGLGAPVSGDLFDVELASGLIEWGRWRDLPALASELAAQDLPEAADPARAAAEARACLALEPILRRDLETRGMTRLHAEVEAPAIRVLAEMEDAGITLDPGALEGLRVEMQARLDELTASCHRLAGREFNVASPKQLGEVLFGELGLTPQGKTAKTGVPSTASDVLEAIAGEHAIVPAVLEHREIAKLLGTYVEVLPRLVNPATGRIHATFHQLGAETGRLSCTEPNLQNIPIRSELGRRIRKAFVAAEGMTLIGADYSQVELRIMAHVSGDTALCEAFARGEDIHRATAATMFGIMPDLVTSEMRSRAKVINFGVIYGMTAHGVAQRLGCTRSEGQQLIDGYFGAYPRMRDTVTRLIEEVRQHPRHEARTLFGRARALPEIVSRNQGRRAFAERAAVNTVIQGTAADLMKLAMIRASERLRREFPAARLLVQVHDELVAEAPLAEADAALHAMIQAMEGVSQLRAPLVAQGGKGRTWYDLK